MYCIKLIFFGDLSLCFYVTDIFLITIIDYYWLNFIKDLFLYFLQFFFLYYLKSDQINVGFLMLKPEHTC